MYPANSPRPLSCEPVSEALPLPGESTTPELCLGAALAGPAAGSPSSGAQPSEAEISAAELQQEVELLCQEHGADWPRGIASELARRAGVSKQALSGRKARTLAELERQA